MTRIAREASAAVLLAALLAASACSNDKHPTTPATRTRTYFMGFTAQPPKPDFALLVATLNLWTPRADAALILNELPWDSLLAGTQVDSFVIKNQLPLAQYYRSKGLRLVVSLDPTNGLDRSKDSAPLVAAGRSLTEPAIQQLFRAYATALDTIVRPDYMSVASETNLIRAIAPASLYAAVVQAANDAAADIRSHDASVKLYTTVQVEVAWGRLGSNTFQGIATDRADFPFIDVLGLSSYPYLGGFSDPDSVPLDYYDRLDDGDPIPMMVIEGGWTSDSLAGGAIPSTPEKQRRYIERHAAILDRARAVGWFQITFTDLDVASIPVPPGTSLEVFAFLGLVDIDLNPKPALTAWDAAFARPRSP